MSNWCNCQLTVFGTRPRVLAFSRKEPPSASSEVWRPHLHGETGELWAARITAIGTRWASKTYGFQVPNDDGKDYFTGVSSRYPALTFVLSYTSPSNEEYGSYFIRNGRAVSYLITEELTCQVMLEYGYRIDYGDDSKAQDDDDWKYWLASAELMDVAEARWRAKALTSVGAPAEAKTRSRRRRKC